MVLVVVWVAVCSEYDLVFLSALELTVVVTALAAVILSVKALGISPASGSKKICCRSLSDNYQPRFFTSLFG
jgi:hypothetical protein